MGSLMYASLGTRPDITFAVQHISQFLTAPSNEHWTAVKQVFRYLNGTINLGITYKGGDKHINNDGDGYSKSQSFSDADWAGNVTD